MIEDMLAKIEEIADGRHTGRVTIDRIWLPGRLPWSAEIQGEKGAGFGTGNTLAEALEDMLDDYERGEQRKKMG